MAITFTQEKKKQRYMILILAVAILAGLGVIWWGFFSAPPEEAAPPTLTFKKVQINFDILNREDLKNLMSFERVPPLEMEVGRENPFLRY
jgi:hypothetical protein